jgi:hypothetical protein
LILRLLADTGAELYAIAETWGNRAYEAPLAAHEALTQIVDFFVRHGPLVRAIADAAAGDEQIEAAYQALLESFIEKTTEVLDRRVRSGELQLPDPGAVARALNLMNQSYLLHEFGGEPQGDPGVALATLETIWLRVAGPGAGR